MEEKFKEALINEDKKLFKEVLKADLHAHALLSSNRDVFSMKTNLKLPKMSKINDINSMNSFVKDNLGEIITTKEGQFQLYECSIISAIDEGVSVFDISFDFRSVYKFEKVTDYIKVLSTLLNKYKDKINLHFDLGINRKHYTIEDNEILKELIDSKIFTGIDIFGDELSVPIKKFKKIYRYAKRSGLILKAHVGEFGNAKDIGEAIKTLKLDMVQHGITIVNDEKIMKYALRKKVVFNICPTSNLLLSRVTCINDHPIRKMYDFGLKVTINTDDKLLFENSLYKEYQLLYKAKVFSIEELDKIRKNGLSIYK